MFKITSEEPIEHWRFLRPQGKIVLDLGCGKFYSSISTAQWFLDQGASFVIGVDLGKENIIDDKFIAYAKAIQSKEDIEYFLKYNPQLIKSDIEGAEMYFKDIAAIPSLEEIAIEYHDENTNKICVDKLKEWGFVNIQQYQLFNEDVNRIGVYHAWK